MSLRLSIATLANLGLGTEIKDYTTLKTWARKHHKPVTDLLALAPTNDPYYAGSPAGIAQAEWFAELWRKGGFSAGAHLRRLHYWCVSQPRLKQVNGLPYENTEGCWQWLCQASKAARYLGLVDIADIADHKNPEPHIFADYRDSRELNFQIYSPVFELQNPDIEISGFNRAAVQRYHLEIWVEKSTMNDVLEPVCRQYGTNLVTGEGELSLTAVHRLVERVKEAEKPARIFYISDFDPAGQSMPRSVSRKIEWLVKQAGSNLDIKVRHLVLTREQVEEYRLPRTPIKETERRMASFEAQHGQGAVELDALEALHPGVLAKIVRDALDRHFDYAAAVAAEEMEKSLRQAIGEKVQQVTRPYAKHIKALQKMSRELNGLRIENLAEYQPPEAEPEEDTPDGCWLFDTNRAYLEQMVAYKRCCGTEARP